MAGSYFGAWRLWEEVSEAYPSFSFLHSHGLGFATGPDQPAPLRKLLALRNCEHQRVAAVRRFFEGDQLRNKSGDAALQTDRSDLGVR
jgi:hypothetical protein